MENNQSNKTQVATLGTKIKEVKNWLANTDNLDRINGIFNNNLQMVSRFKDSLIVQMSKNPKIALCSTASIIQCAFDIALSGLMPDGRNAHLVPFKDKCTVIFDYKGYVSQILKNPDYVDVKAIIVYANEEFEVQFGDVITHKNIIDPSKRGQAIGCYSMVKHSSGERLFNYMSKEEIEVIRDGSQGYKTAKKYNNESIWDVNTEEMWKKTVIRRHQKTLKLDAEANHMFTVPEVDLYKEVPKKNSNYGQSFDIEHEPSVDFEETQDQVEEGK